MLYLLHFLFILFLEHTFEPVNFLLEFLNGLLSVLGASLGLLKFGGEGLQLLFEFFYTLVGLFFGDFQRFKRVTYNLTSSKRV